MDARTSILVLFIGLTVACGGSAGQTVAASHPGDAAKEAGEAASVAEEPAYPKIDIPHQKFVLDNGLTVIVHEDHKAPVVAVNVWYHVGSKNERPGKTGFAHLFEHLMFQGSENFEGEFFEPLEKAGATDLNGTTNNDRTNYFQTMPRPALDVALWMESDRMGHFAGSISQERLDEQRGVVQNEKRQGQNRPYGKAWELIPPNTYPVGHPYSWSVIGSMDDLNAASLEDVKEWFGEYYGASNAVVVLAGDITPAEAKQKAEKFFGHIAPGPAVPRQGPWVAKMTERKELTTFDQVPQERTYFVYNLPEYGSRTTEELRVASWVLARGKNSRLYKRLVYDDQLATSVFAWLGDGEIGSQLLIVADARPGVSLEKVEAAISEELGRLREEGPTPDELARVKMDFFAELVSNLERVGGFGGKSDLLAEHEVFLDDPGAYKRVFGYLRAAGPDAVRDATREWLRDDGVFVLRVLPAPERETLELQADRSSVPSPGQVPSLDLPEFQRATLSNGIEVVLAERHDTPVVKVTALFDVGFGYDKAAKLGTTKFALDVLDEGTESMSSLELAAELERLGASISTSTNLDDSQVALTTLSTTLDPALELFTDIISRPAFAPKEVERIRRQILARIDQEKSRPFSSALRVLGPLLYGDSHPYGVPLTGSGTTESVKSLTRDDLVSFHQSVIHPERATLLVVGDTTMEEVKPKLEEHFGSWSTDVKAAALAKSKAPDSKNSRVYLLNKPDAEQSLIIAGHLIGERDNDSQMALDAMNAIIGGTFTARINMNLREDKHWSYGARSFIYESSLEQLFGAYAQVQTDKTSESMSEIDKELTEYLSSRPPTEEELQRTKDNKTRQLPGQNETTGRLLSSVQEVVRYGLADDYWDTYVDRMDALTVDEIRTTAKQNIRPDELTWIVIGDLKEIEAKVRALNLGEVTVLDADGKALTGE